MLNDSEKEVSNVREDFIYDGLAANTCLKQVFKFDFQRKKNCLHTVLVHVN